MREALAAELEHLASPEGAWSYQPGGSPASEPTALAGLALELNDPGDPRARNAADWLARHQEVDGHLGVTTRLREPGWTSPQALLLWTVSGRHPLAARSAAAWLLDQRGLVLPDPAHIMGHDAGIPGWSWVAGTHSWVEPTAWAVLALRRSGRGAHMRVQDGLRLLEDRAIPSGGWNYGNRTVFGRALRPQPGPTGLTLLALRGTSCSSEVVERSLDYLERSLPDVRAGVSLGWGLLGLTAWNRRPAHALDWIERAWNTASRSLRPRSPMATAALLLGAIESAPEELLPIHPKSGTNAHG